MTWTFDDDHDDDGDDAIYTRHPFIVLYRLIFSQKKKPKNEGCVLHLFPRKNPLEKKPMARSHPRKSWSFGWNISGELAVCLFF